MALSLPDPYRCSAPIAWWVVGLRLFLRHATESRPGALPGGEWASTLCGTWIRIPFDTPPPREPRTRGITQLCPQCTEVAVAGCYHLITFDY